MGNVVIRNTVSHDAARLLADMRAADRRECLAYGTDDYAGGVRTSIAASVFCWSAFDDHGELLAVFGVAPLSMATGVGSPWMLGTTRLRRHARDLMRICPGYIEWMLETFPYLTNYVHAHNETSVRWLRRLGFILKPPAPYGLIGAPFRQFDMRR